MKDKEIRWGVIGAGDVVMRKSGMPLQSLPDSRWVALCRRDRAAAEEVASRFHVPHVHNDAESLLNDGEVNAVYIATPPSSHAEYAIKALESGRDVYLEKPMAMNLHEAQRIRIAMENSGRKLVMAHYRRALPAFETVKGLLESGAIGRPLFAGIRIIQSPAGNSGPFPWRQNPAISGGGLFHDLAPHQIDLCLDWFGEATAVSGFSRVLAGHHGEPGGVIADDYVSGRIGFSSGMQLDGIWCFRADSPERSSDEFAIYGSGGRIRFSFFGEEVCLERGGGKEVRHFSLPEWLQEPMIARTVDYFLRGGENPCSAEIGVETMRIIDAMAGNHNE